MCSETTDLKCHRRQPVKPPAHQASKPYSRTGRQRGSATSDGVPYNGQVPTAQRLHFGVVPAHTPRMRKMRRLILLVLCLLMPLQGQPAVAAEAAPCPMQGMMDMDADTGPLTQGMTDCCNDLATFERTGEACKTSQACSAPAAGSAPCCALVLLAQAVHLPAPPVWRTLPPGLPTALWRPPASI